jgi:hypothetical protein
MNTERLKTIKDLLNPLFADSEKQMIPASESMIFDFRKQLSALDIPLPVVEELCDFYTLTNGIPCLDGFDFHSCDDEIIFEWWADAKELWLGQRDDDVFRWTNGKYCFGDASNVKYSTECGFDNLIELLKFILIPDYK